MTRKTEENANSLALIFRGPVFQRLKTTKNMYGFPNFRETILGALKDMRSFRKLKSVMQKLGPGDEIHICRNGKCHDITPEIKKALL